MLSHLSCKSHNIEFEQWHGMFQLTAKDHKVPEPNDLDYLRQLFELDFTAIEAVDHVRIQTIKSGMVTVTWQDAYGSRSLALSNNDQLRYFYKQNPRFKKSMDTVDAVDSRIHANKPPTRRR